MDSIACPETSVHVCFGGKQSNYFSKIRKCFYIFGLFCIINRYFEYRIRICCIELYMGTLFKTFFDMFSKRFKNCPISVNIFLLTIFSFERFGIFGPHFHYFDISYIFIFSTYLYLIYTPFLHISTCSTFLHFSL